MKHLFFLLTLLLIQSPDVQAQLIRMFKADYTVQADATRFRRHNTAIKQGILIGALAGAAIGTIVGYTRHEKICILQTGECVDRGPVYAAAYGAAIGTALGAGAGLTIGITSQFAQGGNGLRNMRYQDQELHFTSTTFPEAISPKSTGIGVGFKL